MDLKKKWKNIVIIDIIIQNKLCLILKSTITKSLAWNNQSSRCIDTSIIFNRVVKSTDCLINIV